MKKFFTLFLCGSVFYSLTAQTTLFSENFNGASPSFTLNTTDVSSTSSGYNAWVINSAYSGGSFTEPCFGLGVTVGATNSQPGAITGSPASGYMHMLSYTAATGGVNNCNFMASDGGAFCNNDENYFTRQLGTISTVGYTGVSISFWWLCAGSTTNYGELYYSTNGGSTWNLQLGNLRNQSSWIQATQTNSLWDNQPSLTFGYRFVNGTSFSASDPGFAVDEIVVTGNTAVSNTITTGTPSSTPYCAGTSISIPYIASGTFNPGNIFTAQLSDATGSFASPVTLGTLSSTTSGVVMGSIAPGTPSGAGYQVRVVSSNPAVTGSTSTSFVINAQPTATASNGGPYCAGATVQLASSGGVTYSWNGPSGYASVIQNPTIASSTTSMTGNYTVTVTDNNGCTNTATTALSVLDCSGVEDVNPIQLNIYPNPATDVFTIAVNEAMLQNAEITVMNMVGQTIYTFTPNQLKTNIDTQSLGMRAGVYLIQINDGNRHKTTRLVVR